MKMFSVIIPLYNKEEYIQRTLNSVLAQSFKEFEVIIVDDGSTDNSLEIVEKNNDSRIHILKQVNQGVSAARNIGILNAKYDLVAFIDADDTWDPQFLKEMYHLIEKFPIASLYYSNYKLVNEKRQKRHKESEGVEYMIVDDYFEFTISNPPVCASSVVIKKRVLNEFGAFPLKISRGEDLYLWTNIALKYKIAYTNFIGAFYYRDIPNSLTKKSQNLSESFSSFAEEFYHLNKYTVKNKNAFKEYMTPMILSKSKYLIQENKVEESRSLIKQYSSSKRNKRKAVLLYIYSYIPKALREKL